MRIAWVAVLAACSSPPAEPAPGCNPLVGDDCLSPFPSSFNEVADSSSPTGVRLAIDESVLPTPHGSVPLSATRVNHHDGISPSTPFVVYFADGVDVSQLPTLATLELSVQPDSAVQVIEMD